MHINKTAAKIRIPIILILKHLSFSFSYKSILFGELLFILLFIFGISLAIENYKSQSFFIYSLIDEDESNLLKLKIEAIVTFIIVIKCAVHRLYKL